MADEDVAALVVDNGSGMCKAGFTWIIFLYKRTLRYTKPIYSSKMGKAASRIYFTGEFQFSIQASGISRDSVTGLIYTD